MKQRTRPWKKRILTMHKSLFLFILVCSLLFTTGCSARYKPQGNMNQNYNNHWLGTLWLTDDAAYYSYSFSKGFPTQYYKQTASKKTKIVSSTPYDNCAFVDNDVLYLLDTPNDDTLCLRAFDVNTQEETFITYLEEDDGSFIFQFFIFNNNAYYATMTMPSPTEPCFQLNTLSLDTLERKTIVQTNEWIEVGVADDKIAYIFPKGIGYSFSLYDPSTKETIKSLEMPYNMYDGIDRHNFTSEYVIATTASKVICYNWHTQTHTDYFYDEDINNLTAYDQYAFMNTFKGNLYRIHLQTGTSELIGQTDGRANLYVTSDEDVYVIYESGKVYHYNIDGERKHVLTMR